MSRLCVWCAQRPPRSATADTCDQRCAGLLSAFAAAVADPAAMRRWKEVRATYANTDKGIARRQWSVLLSVLPIHGSSYWPSRPRVLVFYGGGIDVDLIHDRAPGVEIVAVERDKSLWPAMRVHSERAPFTPVFGELEDRGDWRGSFALIVADTCSEPTAAARVLRICSRLAAPDAPIYLTSLEQNRRGIDAFSRDYRDIASVAIFSAESGGRSVAKVHTYRQANGKTNASVWLAGDDLLARRPCHCKPTPDWTRWASRDWLCLSPEAQAVYAGLREIAAKYHTKAATA